MKIELVNQKSDSKSVEVLSSFYEKGILAPEKKPFLLDLKNCAGPFLAIDGGGYILDAASQIASVGLGFNISPLFGVGHFEEAWFNEKDTEHLGFLREAMKRLLVRSLGWEDGNIFLCNSGAEANEVALGDAFIRRENKEAKKVLAFEGSFHGRMMVSLSATWNPKKREPFAMPGFESIFASYPDSKFDDVREKEQESLSFIRNQLESGSVFALIIEAMQCEGGERYSRAEFHQELIILCREFDVPVIYDEVQTGFCLGGEFFWHRSFDLKDGEGNELYPDYVTCAKKAQVGIVCSKNKIDFSEEFSTASLVRGYIHGTVLEQRPTAISKFQDLVQVHLDEFVSKFSEFISYPRVRGLAFAFDLHDEEHLKKAIEKRFDYGLLFYQAGSHAARFRLNLAYGKTEVELLFSQLEKLFNEVFHSRSSSDISVCHDYRQDPSSLFELHENWVLKKSGNGSSEVVFEKAANAALKCEGEIVEIRPENFSEFIASIEDLEIAAYEPIRRDPIEKFEKIVSLEKSVALAFMVKGELVGMAFSGNISKFKETKGIIEDPFNDREDIHYSLDVTIHPDFQGKGIGKYLKYCVAVRAADYGITAIHGRNRDKYASAMISINLSIGAYELKRLIDDYPDDLKFRDCFYYREPLLWENRNILSSEFVKKNYPALVTKATLSNFVTKNYLENIESFLRFVPDNLQHLYAASGQSECVDKIVKVLWKSHAPRTRLLTFSDSFFGAGSFLSRGLSQIGESYFPVDVLERAEGGDPERLLEAVSKRLDVDDILGVFIEPKLQNINYSFSLSFLKELKKICGGKSVPLIYNDTAGLFNSFSKDVFSPSLLSEIEPDVGFSFLGGQMGVVYMREELYLADPLLLISTWDGDEFSLASFLERAKGY